LAANENHPAPGLRAKKQQHMKLMHRLDESTDEDPILPLEHDAAERSA
jgi:hypothetical protein